MWGNLQTVEWDRKANRLFGGSDPRNPVGSAGRAGPLTWECRPLAGTSADIETRLRRQGFPFAF